MTEDVNLNTQVSGSSGEIEENCGLHESLLQDLPKAASATDSTSSDCNGITDANVIAKDSDADNYAAESVPSDCYSIKDANVIAKDNDGTDSSPSDCNEIKDANVIAKDNDATDSFPSYCYEIIDTADSFPSDCYEIKDANVKAKGNDAADSTLGDCNRINDVNVIAKDKAVANSTPSDCNGIKDVNVIDKDNAVADSTPCDCNRIKDANVIAKDNAFADSSPGDCNGIKDANVIAMDNTADADSTLTDCNGIKDDNVIAKDNSVADSTLTDCNGIKDASVIAKDSTVADSTSNNCNGIKDANVIAKDNADDLYVFDGNDANAKSQPVDNFSDKQIESNDAGDKQVEKNSDESSALKVDYEIQNNEDSENLAPLQDNDGSHLSLDDEPKNNVSIEEPDPQTKGLANEEEQHKEEGLDGGDLSDVKESPIGGLEGEQENQNQDSQVAVQSHLDLDDQEEKELEVLVKNGKDEKKAEKSDLQIVAGVGDCSHSPHPDVNSSATVESHSIEAEKCYLSNEPEIEEKVSALSCGDMNPESQVAEGQVECPGDNGDGGSSIENKCSLPTCSVDKKMDSEVKSGILSNNDSLVHKVEVLNDSDVSQDSVVVVETDCSQDALCVENVDGEVVIVGNGNGENSVENKCSSPTCSVDEEMDSKVENNSLSQNDVAVETDQNCAHNAVHVENAGCEVDSIDEQTYQKVESLDAVPANESIFPPRGSTVGAFFGQNTATEAGKRSFYYLIKIPRYDDEKLKEQIEQAWLQVEEKTKIRDAIQAEIRTKRAICKNYDGNFEVSISEENAARDLLKAKRREIDSLVSLITYEDIDGEIHKMEHMMQHETLDLKEEKLFIRCIKELKQRREQLSSNLSQNEVRYKDHKEQFEENLKLLRKEFDSLKGKVLQKEAATKDAKKKCQDEKQKLDELQRQFQRAAEIRQKAYVDWQNLKGKLREKNQYFFKYYKEKANKANDLAMDGSREELSQLCISQVEEVMELWNNNAEFRKDYVRCNMRSTLRRLRTLDGRFLGPDEEPPIIPVHNVVRVAMDNAVASTAVIEGEQQLDRQLLDVRKTNDRSTPKDKKKNQNLEIKVHAKHSLEVEGEGEANSDEPKPTREEMELARKAEASRKEEEEAKLREQRKLEERTKAREATERKKRNAEKAQARAALKAQKEAEEREKEREKRARKKERRKALAESTSTVNEGEDQTTLSTSETITETEMREESEMREKSMAAITKQLPRQSQFMKQNKAKSMPPPLRNRGKRKEQTWMWVVIVTVVLVFLFYYW